jgi:hypothetical protein
VTDVEVPTALEWLICKALEAGAPRGGIYGRSQRKRIRKLGAIAAHNLAAACRPEGLP